MTSTLEVICPGCGRHAPLGSRICRHCGGSLNGARVVRRTARPLTPWWPILGLLLAGVIRFASAGLPIWPVLLAATGILGIAAISWALHARLLKRRGGLVGDVLTVLVVGILITLGIVWLAHTITG